MAWRIASSTSSKAIVASTGTENFFACDGHFVANAVENSWLHKTSFAIAEGGDARAACDKFRAFGSALLDITQNSLHLLLADQRAEARLRVHGIAGLHFLHAVQKLFHEASLMLRSTNRREPAAQTSPLP